MEETPKNPQLEIGDRICHYNHGTPSGLTTIVRLTATQAVDNKGDKYKLHIGSGGQIHNVGPFQYSFSASYLQGGELENFKDGLRRRNIGIRLERAARTLYENSFKDVLTSDMDAACKLLELMVERAKGLSNLS
jgi:hypothetical protein